MKINLRNAEGRAAVASLTGVLELIESGQLEASTSERAYIAGALKGLQEATP